MYDVEMVLSRLNAVRDALETKMDNLETKLDQLSDTHTDTTNETMDKKQAAGYLKMSTRSLESLMSKQRIPYHRTTPGRRGRIMFRKSDLDAWLDHGHRETSD